MVKINIRQKISTDRKQHQAVTYLADKYESRSCRIKTSIWQFFKKTEKMFWQNATAGSKKIYRQKKKSQAIKGHKLYRKLNPVEKAEKVYRQNLNRYSKTF